MESGECVPEARPNVHSPHRQFRTLMQNGNIGSNNLDRNYMCNGSRDGKDRNHQNITNYNHGILIEKDSAHVARMIRRLSSLNIAAYVQEECWDVGAKVLKIG